MTIEASLEAMQQATTDIKQASLKKIDDVKETLTNSIPVCNLQDNSSTTCEPIAFTDFEKLKSQFEPYKYNILAGIVFGVALQRGRVHESSTILGQMDFSHFIMLKMFLSASATAILGAIVLEKVFKRSLNRNAMTDKYPRGMYGVMIGASLLGVGMSLTGSCPGSVFVQFGSLSFSSIIVAIGGILGAIAYAQYDSYVYSTTENLNNDIRMKGRLSNGKTRIESLLQNAADKYLVNPTTKTSSVIIDHTLAGYIVAGLMFTIVILLEYFVNWRTDVSNVVENAENVSLWVVNPPMISGILVGISQFISSYYTQRGLGSSSSFSCVAARVLPNEKSPYFCRVGNTHMYQVASMIGAVFGSFISSIFTGTVFSYVGADISVMRNLLGGFLLIFGAQFSGGCTSGHGISGLSYLSTYALLGVASMFGSAILFKILFL